eukprot:TRINITY_DN4193_c0_g1_i1.p1 TRINITY_DN4193_c0_g1~~TRINITY_DN4193_c0_g1_i1.p1  ORF type:complete len:407 (+),score=94.53 TRINITY_DN4193_c0_g1_i1:152-1222(+)
MATTHTAEAEITVTAERPAKVVVDLDTVISVRIFLNARGQPGSMDRVIGQVSIPVREMMEICGRGMYRTWMLLEPWTAYGGQSRSQVAERFRRAVMEIQQDLHSPRICVSLVEASSLEPAEWMNDEQARVFHYQPLLFSHGQHLQAVKAYFEHCERQDLSQGKHRSKSSRNSNSHGAVEASDLRAELEKLQERQRQEEEGNLSNELQQLTDEANRRIEKGNETILRLKADIRQLQDVEEPRVAHERQDASIRLDAARRSSVELQGRLRSRRLEGHFGQLPQLQEQVAQLTEEKAALMMEVQDIYSAQKSEAPSQLGLVGHLSTWNSTGRSDEVGEKLLPDPQEVLSSMPQARPEGW